MSKAINLDFSKFFPADQSFVSVRARASHGDDFYVNLAFGDGENKVTYYVSEHNVKESLKQMQTMLEGLEKTMEFVQKTSALPVVDSKSSTDWFENLLAVPKKSAKKKAASKK